jgi:hypothetical protein
VIIRQFRIGEHQFQADAEDLGSFTSKHTGNNLRRWEIEFRVRGEETNEKVQDTLGKEREVVSLDEAGNPSGTWKVGNTSYSYQSGANNTIYTHTWELIEKEELNLEKLQLGDLEYDPYLYEEDIDDEGILRIRARVRLSSDELAKLHNLSWTKDYFPVIRRGINAEPQEMRFATTLWSEHDGKIKYQIRLIARAYDDSHKSMGLFQPEMQIMQRLLAENTESLLELLTVLKAKDVLTDTEYESIKNVAEGRLRLRIEKLSQVSDIDDWPDD